MPSAAGERDEDREIAMKIDALGSALAGVSSAIKTRNVASHNIANLQTEDFRPLRARQVEARNGDPDVIVSQAEQPEEVDLARELVNGLVSDVQARASFRVIDDTLDLVGNLIDELA